MAVFAAGLVAKVLIGETKKIRLPIAFSTLAVPLIGSEER
jgi:hypothetical protein